VDALLFDGAGTLYLMDGVALRRITVATAEVTTVAGAPGDAGSIDGVGGAARFSLADGLARDSAGNLFVADTQGHTIRKVELPAFRVTTVVGDALHFGVHLGALPARLQLPQSLAVLPDDSLVIADEGALLHAAF